MPDRATLELHKLIGVEVHEREVMGEVQKCISIPMSLNGINIFKGKFIYMNFWLSPRKPNKYGYAYSLSLAYHKTMKDWYFKIKNMGFWEQVKYIGYIYKGRYSQYNKPKGDVNIDDVLNTE